MNTNIVPCHNQIFWLKLLWFLLYCGGYVCSILTNVAHLCPCVYADLWPDLVPASYCLTVRLLGQSSTSLPLSLFLKAFLCWEAQLKSNVLRIVTLWMSLLRMNFEPNGFYSWCLKLFLFQTSWWKCGDRSLLVLEKKILVMRTIVQFKCIFVFAYSNYVFPECLRRAIRLHNSRLVISFCHFPSLKQATIKT